MISYDTMIDQSLRESWRHDSVKCPKCNSNKTHTVWIRHKENWDVRERECSKCGYRFRTKEIIDEGWDYKAILMEIYKKLNEYMTPQELK